MFFGALFRKNKTLWVSPQDNAYNLRKLRYVCIMLVGFFTVNLAINVFPLSRILMYTLELLLNGIDVEDKYIMWLSMMYFSFPEVLDALKRGFIISVISCEGPLMLEFTVLMISNTWFTLISNPEDKCISKDANWLLNTSLATLFLGNSSIGTLEITLLQKLRNSV